jgi:hypothetical protein
MPNQGLLAINVFETISFSILLILFFILDRGRPARFFRYWIAGWAAQTVWAALLMFSVSVPGNAIRIIAQEAHISGIALFLAAICEYTGRKVRPLIFWPAMAFGASLLAAFEWHPATPNSDLHWFTLILPCSLLIVSGWLFWRSLSPEPGMVAGCSQEP